jgi:sugar O-acyltransferase (sialic acid O-acetyltransferase NeuD family)
LIIIGAGGHAGPVIDALRSMGEVLIGMTDPRGTGAKGSIPVIGTDDVIKSNDILANGVGNRATKQSSGLGRRKAVFDQLRKLGCKFPAIIHKTAYVSDEADVYDGAQIMAGAVVQYGAKIGKNTIINTRATVEHDCVIGDHCHIAPGAVLCGGVVLGNEVHIGAGAVVLQNKVIGNGAIIAAGAVVTRDVLDGALWPR